MAGGFENIWETNQANGRLKIKYVLRIINDRAIVDLDQFKKKQKKS